MVHFDKSGKITQIRQYWDQGSLLKQIDVIGARSRNWPIRDLTWDYPTKGPAQEPDAEAVLHEINGYTVGNREAIEGYTSLKDDGSTASGCWIYSGCYRDGKNQTARRKPHWEQS